MHHIYEAFVEALAQSVDELDLVRGMGSFLGAFDLQAFAYLSFPSPRADSTLLISSYPRAWTAKYLRQRYEKIDPVIQSARCRSEPFCWGCPFADKATSEAEVRLFEEAAKFGICCGLTVPIHDRRGGIAAMTFAADRSTPEFERFVDRYQRALQLVATFFHIRARETINGDRLVDGVRLTRREFECLQWAAKGKSARDIGEILGITRRTAAFHLDNTRRKLGVRTRTQAVARLKSSNRLSK